MGVDIETARFLLARRRDKVSFERCATLGRQHYFVSNAETRTLLREFGLSPEAFPALFPAAYPDYSEPFWEMLGAKSLATIDASKFEGATHVHDMNQAIPAEWKESYDVVCDVGTLEHVFNFPAAIRNCMEMVKRGGCFFAQTPANNYLGHGFYQFSPELFFRVLSPQNGFKVEHCVAVDQGPRRRWFAVTDPEAARARVTLINTAPVILFVWAKRVEIKPLFLNTPQQSDYAAAWAEGEGKGKRNPSGARPLDRVKNALLTSAPRLARVLDSLRFSRFNRAFSFRNTKSFTRIPRVPQFINTHAFAATDFCARRGASDEHTRQWSVRSEQRSLAQKDLPPGGLRRIWLWALLLLGHRPLRVCSLVAPSPKPNAAQRTYAYLCELGY